MILGGTPYYLDMMQKSQSVAQNIDTLFFAQNAPLRNEFDFLFKSLFKNSELYKAVIETLASKAKGLTRQEIIEATKQIDNGYISEVLDNLIRCDFVRSYHAFGKKERDVLYQLIDLYSLFYLRFVKEYSGKTNSIGAIPWTHQPCGKAMHSNRYACFIYLRLKRN